MKQVKLAVLVFSAFLANAAMAVGDAAAGEGKSAVCAACHGADGNSPAGDFPSLAGQNAEYLFKQMKDYQTGARKDAVMTINVRGLEEQDLQDLAAFYASKKITVQQADPELIELGERVYRGGDVAKGLPSCSGCHGPDGRGLKGSTFPALGGQHASYLEIQLKAFRAAGRDDLGVERMRSNDVDGDGLGMMQAVAAKLSDRELQAVASFISGLGQ